MRIMILVVFYVIADIKALVTLPPQKGTEDLHTIYSVDNAKASISCDFVHLDILVSALVGDNELRRLEIQWENAPLDVGDKITMFTKNTPNEPPQHMVTHYIRERSGIIRTTFMEKHLKPEQLGFQGRCLRYYAVYLDKEGNIMAQTCLRVEPTWMYDNKQFIGDTPLRKLFIPGTHDSASYSDYSPKGGESRFSKYLITQDESVLAQLIYGARYLDLRVGYYAETPERWWGNHGLFKIHPVKVIVDDIRTFLKKTQEIVIFDVKDFTKGFTDLTVHKLFLSFLQSELGEFFASPKLTYNATLNQIWDGKKRLIIGYDYPDLWSEIPFLWPDVVHMWGNVRSLQDLYTYLLGVMERPPLRAWSAQAELTANVFTIMFDLFTGLRPAADEVNHNVTSWFRRYSWAAKTNVVSVDFIRSTGIIQAAIEWNKNKGSCDVEAKQFIANEKSMRPAEKTKTKKVKT